MKKQQIDIRCIEDFVDGDMRAFDEIYSIYSPKLIKFVFSIVKLDSEVEDLVHEVFVKVWENREKIRIKTQSSFSSYLFTIAYNTTISFLRLKVKDSQYVEFVKSTQVESINDHLLDELSDEVKFEQISLLIEQMPHKQREVFKMKYLQQLSYKEIASELGISVNTVENHINRARKFLKENLKGNCLAFLLFLQLFN